MMRHRLARSLLAGGALAASIAFVTASPARAGAQDAGTAARASYLEYRAAFDKARRFDDLYRWIAAAPRAEIEAMSSADRAEAFELFKLFALMSSVTVVKADETPAGVTLSVEGVDDEKRRATAVVELVREGGAWRILRERWTPGSPLIDPVVP
jgi:hypothetical protein